MEHYHLSVQAMVIARVPMCAPAIPLTIWARCVRFQCVMDFHHRMCKYVVGMELVHHQTCVNATMDMDPKNVTRSCATIFWLLICKYAQEVVDVLELICAFVQIQTAMVHFAPSLSHVPLVLLPLPYQM